MVGIEDLSVSMNPGKVRARFQGHASSAYSHWSGSGRGKRVAGLVVGKG